jgi:serine/threonine protein kinase
MPGAVTAGRLVDDRYRLLEPLEEGGMGILWRAEDLISERYVTVKELRFPDPLDHMQRRALAARVRREARAMAAVQHPGLARIVDVVDDLDRPWVVTELVEYPTLADRVRHDGPLAPDEAAALGLRLLDVLDAATDHDMVHRFLQPTKVFVGPDGDVRVADFGIASLIGDATVARDGAVGNVSFMSPEQAGTPEADIWSLGAVLYFAVEGVAPFGGGTSAAILEAVAVQPPRPPERAGALARALEVTLQKDPSERPSSDELRTLLEVAAGPLAPQPEPQAEPDDAITWGDADAGLHRPMDLELGLDLATEPSRNGEADAAHEPEVAEPEVAEVAEPAEPPPPPKPLPPKVALERMFSPDPGAPPVLFTPEEEHREPPEPWPVPRRTSKLTVVLCTAVVLVLLAILFTNGREILTRDARDNRILATVDWATYVHPDSGFRIDYPSDWRVTTDGQYTDFRHPNDAAALRVVVQDANGRTAENGWIELERRFRREQPSYSRIRLEATEFLGYDAAEWEFTYSRDNVALHNLDVGVVTGTKAFTLNFESRASNWSLVQPFMDRFESSFKPPKT